MSLSFPTSPRGDLQPWNDLIKKPEELQSPEVARRTRKFLKIDPSGSATGCLNFVSFFHPIIGGNKEARIGYNVDTGEKSVFAEWVDSPGTFELKRTGKSVDEADVLTKLKRCPGVVALKGAVKGRDVCDPPATHKTLLELEFCNRGDLHSEIHYRAKCPRPLPERISIMALFFEALAQLHEYPHEEAPESLPGYVHNDLKPANILLHRSPDGQLQVKLADLGSAVKNGAIPHQRYCTRFYESPEGSTYKDGSLIPLTTASDCYSAGMVLFSYIFSEIPISQKFATESLWRQYVLAECEQWKTDWPIAIRPIILALIDLKPAQRHTARDVADFFHAIKDLVK